MKHMRWWMGGVVVLGAAGAAWWWAQRDADSATSYRTAKIERGTLIAAVSSSGTVNPVSQVSVGSQVSGQIKEMRADFNTEVKQGQLIARIDPESFEYKVRQASADLESARAAVLNAQANVAAVMAGVSKAKLEADNAQRDAQRKQDLLAKNFISQADYDNSRNTASSLAESLKVAQAQADVARAQAVSAQAVVKQRDAALAQAKVDLERTEIRSPVDGVVIKRSVDVGQTVAASLQAPELFIIARNLQDMQVEASIDEADISRVKPQQAVSFTIDAFPGRSFEGRVSQIRKAAVSSQNVVTYTVVVGFANPGGTVLPGMTANVRIVTDTRENVLKVPNAALRVRIAGVEPAAAPASSADAGGPGRTGAAWQWMSSANAQGAAPGALRERLVEGLQLDATQQARLDEVLADMRPRFAAARDLADAERPAAREKLQAELRERVGAFLTPAQRDRYAQLQAARAAAPAVAAASAPAVTASSPARAAAPRAPASAVAGGGPLGELRNRLAAELQLTPEQLEKVDAVIAQARPRFAELRGLPEEERAKARERILADIRARVAEQLDAGQKARYQQIVAESASRQPSRGRLYLLDAKGKPAAYNVRLGITDGVATELIVAPGSANAGELREGATVITGVNAPGSGAASRNSAPGPRPMF
jgi:HlyD family secretion protein